MKNYLEHDDKVRFVEALLSKSQDWRWFIELIEATYEINDNVRRIRERKIQYF